MLPSSGPLATKAGAFCDRGGLSMSTFSRLGIVIVVVTSGLWLSEGRVWAKATPEQQCQAGRYKATTTYSACVQKLLAKEAGGTGGGTDKFEKAFFKCVAKYAAAWPKLQKKATGTGAACDAARLVANSDGTVTDNLSGLQWEQKTDDGSIHDKDDRYKWSAAGTAADGGAFSTFLAALNGSCFAGQCDWRLPTLAELATLIQTPCATEACVDPLLGPTPTFFDLYWSATTDVSTSFVGVWGVQSGPHVTERGKQGMEFVRAVRGGL
jgi:hypothetical protein